MCVTFEGDLPTPPAVARQSRRTLASSDNRHPGEQCGIQNRKESPREISDEEFDRTFKTNVYAFFRLVKAALPHLQPGSAIIVTGSETGFEGPEMLPDYSATKGALHTLTKVLAKMLAERGVRVNCVAPLACVDATQSRRRGALRKRR